MNNTSGKKEKVRQMFDSIAKRYDLLNHLLSFGIDKRWRKTFVKEIKKKYPNTFIHILDIATGTGDLAFTMLKLNPKKITAVDLSLNMLEVAKEKAKQGDRSNLLAFSYADAEMLPFEPESFDLATVAFGVRNFENLEQGLSEIYRVLSPKSYCYILEFSKITNPVFKFVYRLYFLNILPFIGKIISRDKEAYTYLPQSVENFPSGNDFIKIMTQCRFQNCNYKPLTGGIATIYWGIKN